MFQSRFKQPPLLTASFDQLCNIINSMEDPGGCWALPELCVLLCVISVKLFSLEFCFAPMLEVIYDRSSRKYPFFLC